MGMVFDRALQGLAKAMAKSTIIVGYRGIGRIFGPLSRIPLFHNARGRIRLSPGRRLEFPAFDYYWASYLWTGKPYERDTQAWFEALAHLPNKVLIDAGANIGYWTIKLSDPDYGFDRVIAVEANAYVHDYLARNIALNSIDCVAILAALTSEEGETVHLGGSDRHAAGGVTGQGIPTITVSIASLIRDHLAGRDTQGPIVVKLDVEGSEIAAIKGAPENAELLYIFEDWPRSGMTVTQHLIDSGYSVLGMERDGRLTGIRSVADAIAFNARTTDEYGPSNLLASRTPERYFNL